MSPILPTWQKILVNYINNKVKPFYPLTIDDVVFTHNKFHRPVAGIKRIDVRSASTKFRGQGFISVVPYNVNSYFNQIPVVLPTVEDLTGLDVVKSINLQYGINFDTEVDFDKTFLSQKIILNKDKVINVPISPNSFVWEGSLKVNIVDDTYNLARNVLKRDLGALVTPDISIQRTESLLLLTTPVVITTPSLLTLFNRLKPLVVDDNILALIMDELRSQYIASEEDLNEVEGILKGITLTPKPVENNPDFDWMMTTQDPLKSNKFSGHPGFKFKAQALQDDIDGVVGELIVTQLIQGENVPTSAIDVSVGNYSTSINALLLEQKKYYPEHADSIQKVIDDSKVITVFDSMINTLSESDIANGKGTIYLVPSVDSRYSGKLRVTYPLPEFTIDTESMHEFISAETGEPLSVERRRVKVLTSTGRLVDITSGKLVEELTTAESSLVCLMLLAYVDNKFSLRQEVVDTVTPEGIVYTNPRWPGIEVLVVKG